MEGMADELFTVTVYRDGQIAITGHGRHDRMPDILRLIADSLEVGSTLLQELPDSPP